MYDCYDLFHDGYDFQFHRSFFYVLCDSWAFSWKFDYVSVIYSRSGIFKNNYNLSNDICIQYGSKYSLLEVGISMSKLGKPFAITPPTWMYLYQLPLLYLMCIQSLLCLLQLLKHQLNIQAQWLSLTHPLCYLFLYHLDDGWNI